MFYRPLLFIGVLAAAVLVPYALMEERIAGAARGTLDRLWGDAATNQADSLDEAALSKTSGPGSGGGLAAAAALAPTIEEAFRFDVTPSWVLARWPNVTTVAGDAKALGMRVALVSGTRPDDVAGSLTYYFDEHHQLQRLTFTGLSGDPRRLLATVVTATGLESVPTTHAGHYIAGDPQSPTSQVTVRHLPVVKADASQKRVEVAVDLRRSDVVGWEKKAARQTEPSLLPSSYRRW